MDAAHKGTIVKTCTEYKSKFDIRPLIFMQSRTMRGTDAADRHNTTADLLSDVGGRVPYIFSGAETPMSERASARVILTASQAARRALDSSGSTGCPSLGSTWQLA